MVTVQAIVVTMNAFNEMAVPAVGKPAVRCTGEAFNKNRKNPIKRLRSRTMMMRWKHLTHFVVHELQGELQDLDGNKGHKKKREDRGEKASDRGCRIR
jgi:hypothetical protein